MERDIPPLGELCTSRETSVLRRGFVSGVGLMLCIAS